MLLQLILVTLYAVDQPRNVHDHSSLTYCKQKRCVRVNLVLVDLVDKRCALGDLLGGVRNKVGDHVFGVRVCLPVRDKRGERGVRVLEQRQTNVSLEVPDMDGRRATRYGRYVQS